MAHASTRQAGRLPYKHLFDGDDRTGIQTQASLPFRAVRARGGGAAGGVAFEPDPEEDEFALADVLNPRAYEPVGTKTRLGF